MINISQNEKINSQKLKNLLSNNWKIKLNNNNKLNQKEKRKLNKNKKVNPKTPMIRYLVWW